jgi:benzoate membrane transport protein
LCSYEDFVTALAGLALLGALGGGLGGSFSSEHRREPALITFLATTSGMTFFGIGAAFWGLVAGIMSYFILFGNLKNLRKAN